jgi:hypothetical protein
MAIINIKVGKLGVEKVEATVSNVAEGNLAGHILEVAALSIRLLNDSIRETFIGEPELEASEDITLQSTSVIQRTSDGEKDTLDVIGICVAPGPRQFAEFPADWFVAAVRHAFPENRMWEESTDPMHLALDLCADFSTEYLTPEETSAYLVFQDEMKGFGGLFIRAGWLDDDTEEDRGTVMVFEPCELWGSGLKQLVSFCNVTGLAVRMSGASSHHPSVTMRVEIWKAQD